MGRIYSSWAPLNETVFSRALENASTCITVYKNWCIIRSTISKTSMNRYHIYMCFSREETYQKCSFSRNGGTSLGSIPSWTQVLRAVVELFPFIIFFAFVQSLLYPTVCNVGFAERIN